MLWEAHKGRVFAVTEGVKIRGDGGKKKEKPLRRKKVEGILYASGAGKKGGKFDEGGKGTPIILWRSSRGGRRKKRGPQREPVVEKGVQRGGGRKFSQEAGKPVPWFFWGGGRKAQRNLLRTEAWKKSKRGRPRKERLPFSRL